MPRFKVNVEDSSYQVDAPDERTAWAWANAEHRKLEKSAQQEEVAEMREGSALERFGRGAGSSLENIGYGLKGLVTDLSPEDKREIAINKTFLEGEKGEGIRAENIGAFATDLGSFVFPGGAAIKAARALPAAMNFASKRPLRAALIGEGALGAGLSAAYAPENRDRAAILGGVGGAAGYGIGRAVSAGLKKPIPELEKARNKISDVFGGKSKQETIEELQSFAGSTAGRDLTSAEAAGLTGERTLGALGRVEGKTADELDALIQQRRATRNERIQEDFATELGINPSAAQGNVDDFIKAKKQEAAPLYKAAYNQGTADTPLLRRIIRDPEVKKIIKKEASLLRRKANLTNKEIKWSNYGIKEDGDNFVILDPSVQVPTWKTWDLIKRGLDKKINAGAITNRYDKIIGFTEEVKFEIDLKNALLKELDRIAANPRKGKGNEDWSKARRTAGDYLEAQKAFNQGKDSIFRSTIDEKQFAKLINDFSKRGTDLESFKAGVLNDVFNKLQNNQNILLRKDAPRFKAKLKMLFGDKATENLIKRLDVETQMRKFENRALPRGQSITFEATEAARTGLDEAATAIDVGREIADIVDRPLTKSLSLTRRLLGGKRSNKLSQEAQDELGRLLMLRPQDLAEELANAPTTSQARAEALRRASPYLGLTGAYAVSELEK